MKRNIINFVLLHDNEIRRVTRLRRMTDGESSIKIATLKVRSSAQKVLGSRVLIYWY